MVTCCSAGPRRRAGTPPAAPAAALLAALALAACAPDPVAWDVAREQRLDPPAALDGRPDVAAEALARRTIGGPTPDTTLLTLPPEAAGGTRCPLSLRVAGAAPAPGGRVAAWWAVRPDRSAALYLSRSADAGRTWGAVIPVDTLDRSEAGCDRPGPSVAADSATGYVHVAYSLAGPEGPGVFYAHQMDPRAAFEPPQVIVYGERPAATSVAAQGQRVVVAYEDPNTGGRPFVSLALSRTAGHAWAERVPVTGSTVSAERPVVALRGGRELVLGWVERSAPRTLTGTDDPRVAVSPLPSGVVVRPGRLRE
jgi:hypothetical protein